MLAEAAIWVAAVATVVPTTTFALDDIYPESQGEPPIVHIVKGPILLDWAWFSVAPRDRLELPTKWLTATRSTN